MAATSIGDLTSGAQHGRENRPSLLDVYAEPAGPCGLFRSGPDWTAWWLKLWSKCGYNIWC